MCRTSCCSSTRSSFLESKMCVILEKGTINWRACTCVLCVKNAVRRVTFSSDTVNRAKSATNFNSDCSSFSRNNRTRTDKRYRFITVLSLHTTHVHTGVSFAHSRIQNTNTHYVGGVAQWLGCRSVAGRLSLICA